MSGSSSNTRRQSIEVIREDQTTKKCPFLFGKFFDPSDAFPLWEFDSDILLSNLRSLGQTTVDWFRTPHDQDYVLKADIPGIGVGKNSVQVVYNEKQKAVEVSGVWSQQQSMTINKEWRSGNWWEYGYVRRLELPDDADSRKIEAYLTNDTLLEIKIPKKILDFEPNNNTLANDVMSTKKSDAVLGVMKGEYFVPYDELNLPHYNLDQSLAAVVNQFLSTEDIGAGSSVSTPFSCTLEGGPVGPCSNPPTPLEGHPHSHSVLNASAGGSEAPSRVLCDMPISTMSSVAITAHEEALHAAPYVDHISRLSEKAQGKAVAGAKRAAFTPQSVVVGDSLRNILKRARAGPTIAEVSSAINSTFEQADWSIANNAWHCLFPKATLYHLGFYGSDHRVLKVVLQDESMQGSKVKNFMFENHWLMEDSFFDTVKSAWTNSNLTSYSNNLDHFLSKQGSCIQAIQNWNSSSKSLSKRINALEKSINTLTSNLPLSQDQLNNISSLQSQLDSLLFNIISPNQGAFLSKRVIFDNILIAQEVVHAINHRKQGLSAALRHQERVGLLRGISISRNAPPISHLLFSDDTLLFTIATTSSCHAIKEALTVYHLASGQAVNYGKSSMIFSPNTLTSISDYFFQNLGRKKDSFDFILHRVSSHLNVWNSKLFSRAGKEVLLKAVIQAIPSYAMSCFKIPFSICHKIEKLMAQFWWGSMGNGSKIHWKSWNQLCVSKFFGGLGFRSLVHHNQAMLAKQAWHIYSNPNSLLSVVLKAKYFHHSTFLDAGHGHSPSFTWLSIIWGRDLLKKGLLWKVGNGETIRTVDDYWVPGVRQLQYKAGCFPPSDNVNFFLHPEGHWNREALDTYFDPPTVTSILHVPVGGCDKEDFLIWNNHPSGILSVKTAYHLANAGSLPPSSSNSSLSRKWWTILWSLNIPPKVKTFTWRVYHHILPVALNLFSKKTLPTPICFNCSCPAETVSHALLDCSSAAKTWKSSPFRTFYLSNRHQDVKWFLITAFTELSEEDLVHLLGILWAIRHNRNMKLFANSFMLPNDVVTWATVFITDFQEAQLKKQCALLLQPSFTHQNNSCRLSPGSYRLNTDAALDAKSGKLGFGAVIRDWKNRIVAGLSIPVAGNVDPLMAEALALRSSLLWCSNIKIPLAVIETDSKVLVERIRSVKPDLSALSDVIQDIRLSLSYFPTASIRHIARSHNRNAHCLARKALGLDKEKS
uniref:SHSP domain-containing protein n=1 Tax=Cannabis sativa TaxID=3483 RepID=A0A803QCJ0_CANSA